MLTQHNDILFLMDSKGLLFPSLNRHIVWEGVAFETANRQHPNLFSVWHIHLYAQGAPLIYSFLVLVHNMTRI